MKYIQTIIAFLAILGIISTTYSGSLGVDEIKVIDSNTISVSLSDNPNLKEGEIEGEVTILNDVNTRGAVVSEGSEVKVELMLDEPLLPNTSYSLLTISGADGSIDFTTPENVEGFMLDNPNIASGQDIASIEVLSDTALIVTYRESLSGSALDYKLLAESNIVKMEKPDYFLPEIIITIEPPLMSNKDYILMFIEMQDVEGEYLEFDTGIYDFSTEEIVSQESTSDDVDQIASEENEEAEKIDLEDNTETMDISSVDEVVDMQAAGEEDSLQDVSAVAAQMTETPDTGAETWVLIVATLIINSFFYLSRRKKSTLA